MDYTAAGILLVLRYKEIREAMIQDLLRGDGQFRIGQVNGVVILLVRFGMTPWFNANFHRGRAEVKEVKQKHPAERFNLFLLLVDSETGILKARQHYTMSSAFSRRLSEVVAMQNETVPSNWDIMVRKAYRNRTVPQIAALFGMES